MYFVYVKNLCFAAKYNVGLWKHFYLSDFFVIGHRAFE